MNSLNQYIPTQTLAVKGPAQSRSNIVNHDFPALLKTFSPITLAEMKDVELQDRIDTKFVLQADQLYGVLASITDSYRVLDIRGVRLNRYRTLYFDAADFTLYRNHHNRRRTRYKVRAREYVGSNLYFMEIKFKADANRTIKQRLQTPELVTELSPSNDASSFLSEHLSSEAQGLEPKLWNRFSRITLVSKHRQERVTLDLDLSFSHEGEVVTLPNIVIAEVKQGGHERTSDFMRLMRSNHIRSTGFSKYCIGAGLLYPDLKRNNFQPQHRLLHRLSEGDSNVKH